MEPAIPHYWAARSELVPRGTGLYIYGAIDVVRTAATVKLATDLAAEQQQQKGPLVYCTQVADLRRHIYPRRLRLKRLRSTKFLVLDGLAASDLTDDWFSLMRLIETRRDAGRPTFVTSELTPKDLAAAQPLFWKRLRDTLTPCGAYTMRPGDRERLAAILGTKTDAKGRS